ncbi:OmpH family outer membrane protein [bacterium]|nr:OmpH family outer membrane protein [bacterium]
MKKSLLVLAGLILAMGMTNVAKAADKIAVVSVPQVVEASAQVQALKKEQQAKMQELEKWLTTVRADVDKQQTKEGKEKLIKKYDEEFLKRQESITRAYTSKLQAIDTSITATITNEAKALGYTMVIAKGVVLYGGTDITEQIMKKVK